uniref:NADH dehydrogenase subunit 4L n=1 Tax=Trinectes inscriptus TaxID=722570 RepID=UPI0028FCC9A4|nr:NADH dehydrogenase subunit 4L [Trinectes inscriptus]WNH37699.1 NADH dehydrogenase subunit 4L [Trinectes inscriptus]
MTPTHFTFSSMFILGLAGLTFHRQHLISAIICLEGMMLSLFLALSLWSLQLTSANFSAVPMLFLVFAACETSAGLALMVATNRTHGTDRLQSLNLLQC